ncbi:MAG: Ig-like domain-containing protein [Treponemataceae bacterium]|nr:Ig-like domain-containing protein [Treponemataceae bacterium]
MTKNLSKIALFAAAAFMLAFLPACSGDDGDSGSSSVAVTGVTVSADKTTLYVSGDNEPHTATLTATVAPENATDKTVSWFPVDSPVVEVSPATGNEITVTAKSAGVVTVTARAANDKTATVELTVFMDKASQDMFSSIVGSYEAGEISINIDAAGFVTVGDKKSDKPAVVDGSKLTVTIDGALHTITVASDGSLTFDDTAMKALKPTLRKNDGEPTEYDTIKDALAAIPATGTDTYTITLQPGKYRENGLSYNGSATVVIEGKTDAKFGKDVVIMGKGSSQLDAMSRCLLYVGETANVVLKNVTLQNTLKRTDPDIPVKDGSKQTQAEAFGFGSSGTVTAYNASFLGHQDTVRTVGKAWFYQCYLEGDVDFLWMETSGQVALYEDCEIKMVGDEMEKTYVAAPRSTQTSPVGKGLVIYNSKVIVDSKVTEGYLARTPWDKGYYNQVAYINTTVDGTLKAVWYGAPIATEFPKTDIGWKLCPVTAAACSHTGEDVLSERMTAREYNGRYVILNRVFDTKAKQYKTAETPWDAAKDLGITDDDASKNNIFLDYADVTKTSIGDELVVTDFNGNATGVTWSVKAFRKYEDGVLSEPVDGLTIADGKVTSSLTGNFYAEVTAKKGDASDSLILYNVTATAISLSQSAVSIAEGSDVTLTATFEPEGADAEVVWTSSDASIATVEGGKVVAQSGKAGSTATITATIKGTELKATCTVTVTAAVSLKKFGTSVAGAEFTNYNKIGTNEYLVYPVPITAGEAYAIEAKIKYATSTNIGVGIVTFKDGAYSNGIVGDVAFATPEGIKLVTNGTANGQGYNEGKLDTNTFSECTIKAYTKTNDKTLYFSLINSNGKEYAKSNSLASYAPAETDFIYLAIGGISDSGASVNANDITITVGDNAPAKVAKFEDLAADTRTALSLRSSLEVTLDDATYPGTGKGNPVDIDLTEDLLSKVEVHVNNQVFTEGKLIWNSQTVSVGSSETATTTATFIPSDRSAYKAILGGEVQIKVNDNRSESSTKLVTITYDMSLNGGKSKTGTVNADYSVVGYTAGADNLTAVPITASSLSNTIEGDSTGLWDGTTGRIMIPGNYSPATENYAFDVEIKVGEEVSAATITSIKASTGGSAATGNYYIDVYISKNKTTWEKLGRLGTGSTNSKNTAAITYEDKFKDGVDISLVGTDILYVQFRPAWNNPPRANAGGIEMDKIIIDASYEPKQ